MTFAASALPLIATGLSVVGTVVSTVANVQAAQYQAEVAARNQRVQEQNARRSIELAQEEQLRSDQIARGLIGQQIAAQAASGLSLNGQSQMLTRKSARRLARIDARNIREAGELEAYNFRVAAADSAAQAGFARQRAGFSLAEGFLTAAGTAIGGTSSLIKPSGISTIGPSRYGGGKLLRLS